MSENLKEEKAMKKRSLMTIAILAALLGLSTLAVFAQHTESIAAEKSGRFHLGKAARISDKSLEAGMYQVQHFDEKGEHIVTFRKVNMGYRGNMGNQKLGEEVLRVKCDAEQVDKRIGDTKVLIRKTASGEREIFEVWIRGQKVKHVLPAS